MIFWGNISSVLAGNFEQDVADFVRRHIQLGMNGDIDDIMALYWRKTHYYTHGFIEKEKVREDKLAYFKKWPKRRYDLTHIIYIKKLPDMDIAVKFNFLYIIGNPERRLEGEAWSELILRPQAGRYYIFSEQGGVSRLEGKPGELEKERIFAYEDVSLRAKPVIKEYNIYYVHQTRGISAKVSYIYRLRFDVSEGNLFDSLGSLCYRSRSEMEQLIHDKGEWMDLNRLRLFNCH